MSITFEQINQDLKEALKKQDKVRVSVFRLLISEIHNLEIQKKQKATPDDVLNVLQQARKRHQDSIFQFTKGGRSDLVTQEQAELEIIESYLPKPLSSEELNKLVQGAISQSGAATAQDFGIVMKHLMPKLKGQADGATVSEAVKQALAKI